jgi:hypothetical protein
MSYCRCGDDSDVYVWVGNVYCIILCIGKYHVDKIMKDNNLEHMYYCDTAEETLNKLLKLSLLELTVPNRAITRLQREIKSR